MQLDPLALRKPLLFDLELRRQVEQPQLLFLFRNDFVEEGQVIAEEKDGRRIIDLRIFPDVMLEENRRHGRDVLMTEAQISTGETGIARLHCRHANCSVFIKHVLREDFLCESHRARGAGALVR